MITVVDAIMGSGKSSAAITYINEHPDTPFIYITPFLDEAARIKEACPAANFIEPSNKVPVFGFSKLKHIASLVKKSKNIATTHQSFSSFTPEMIQDIRDAGYTMIIDESVDVLHKVDIQYQDIAIAKAAGLISVEDDGRLSVNHDVADEYTGLLSPLLAEVQRHELFNISTSFYWEIDPKLFDACLDIFVLTYMFEGQSLYNMFLYKKIDFRYGGIGIREDGVRYFSDRTMFVPKYTKNIKNMISVLDNKRMNRIGDDKFALSISWYKKNDGENLLTMSKHLVNYFHNIHGKKSRKKKMWSMYGECKGDASRKQYAAGFVAFNARATNSFREKDILAYPVNIFMNVAIKSFYCTIGVPVNEDIYALSTMVQWIWRSAIRDGKPVTLYLPSKRMRDLLTGWMDSLSEGGDAYDV